MPDPGGDLIGLSEILDGALRRTGMSALEERARMVGALKASGTADSRSVNLLMTAYDAGVPGRLREAGEPPSTFKLGQESAQIVENFGTRPDLARAVVEAWASVLAKSADIPEHVEDAARAASDPIDALATPELPAAPGRFAPPAPPAAEGPSDAAWLSATSWPAGPATAPPTAQPPAAAGPGAVVAPSATGRVGPSEVPARPPSPPPFPAASGETSRAPATGGASVTPPPLPRTEAGPPPLPPLRELPLAARPVPAEAAKPLPLPPAPNPAAPKPAASKPAPLPLPSAAAEPPKPLPPPPPAAAVTAAPRPLPLPGTSAGPKPLPGAAPAAPKPLPGVAGAIKPLPGMLVAPPAAPPAQVKWAIIIPAVLALIGAGLWGSGVLRSSPPKRSDPPPASPPASPPPGPTADGGRTDEGFAIAEPDKPGRFQATRIEGQRNTLIFAFGLRVGPDTYTYQAAAGFEGQSTTGVALIKAVKRGQEASTGEVSVSRVTEQNGYAGFQVSGPWKGTAIPAPPICVKALAGRKLDDFDLADGGGGFCAYGTNADGACDGDKVLGCGDLVP